MQNCKTILDLPLELLDFIFKQLSPSQKLRLADSHPILAEAFHYQVGDLFRKVNYQLLAEDWSFILRLCGSDVLEIDTGERSVDNRALQLVERHCTNLEYFKTYVNKKNVNAVCSLLLRKESLKSVALKFLEEFDKCDPEYTIHVLKQLPALRNLKIGFIPEIKIYLIEQFVDLEELDLSVRYEYDLSNINIFEILAPLRKLRSLKVSGCDIHGTFQNDGLSYQVLEHLGVTYCDIDYELPFFPMLKSIEINNTGSPGYEDLKRSMNKHKSTLKKVVLIVECFCENSMLDLIKNCRKLRYLYVHPKVSDTISKESMLSFINILKENGVTPQNPFQLTM
ncbi:hypothetical protein KR084_002874, partial [Drosophila pseudotakahashii]